MVKHAPPEYEFTMTTVIGEHQVVNLSLARETFAMVIESEEYAEMQRNFFEVLWSASKRADEDGTGVP